MCFSKMSFKQQKSILYDLKIKVEEEKIKTQKLLQKNADLALKLYLEEQKERKE